MTTFSFPAIGTQWQIDIYSPISSKKLSDLKIRVFARIEEFDQTYSRFKKNSWVIEASKKLHVPQIVPDDFPPLFSLYKSLYQASQGLCTPLIGKLLEQAGYDSDYSLSEKTLTHPPALENAIQLKGGKIIFKEPVVLDFGAAGKGYLVDIVAKLLTESGIDSFCIDASGDILHKDLKDTKIRVGLEHPDDPALAIGVCELLNKSICGSAGNRRKWGNFHHTINPFTLQSPDEVKATWIVADNASLADGLATCLFLDPNPEHYRDFNFECVLLYKDNSAFISRNFPGELYTG